MIKKVDFNSDPPEENAQIHAQLRITLYKDLHVNQTGDIANVNIEVNGCMNCLARVLVDFINGSDLGNLIKIHLMLPGIIGSFFGDINKLRDELNNMDLQDEPEE